MNTIPFCALVAASLGQVPLAAQTVHLETLGPDVAVHDALAQDSPFPFDTMRASEFKTDVDRDGIIDLALWSGDAFARFMRGGDLKVEYRKKEMVLTGIGQQDKLMRLDYGAPFNRGGNIAGASSTFVGPFPLFDYSDARHLLVVWDFTDGQLLKNLPLPNPPGPGLPHVVFAGSPSSLGDLDGDGFDELLIEYLVGNFQPYLGIAVVDGATLEYKFTEYYPAAGASALMLNSSWPDPCEDVDGDGTKDIFLVSIDDSFFDPQWSLRCVSGSDGSELWLKQYPSDGTSRATIVDDLDGDGIRDIFFAKEAAPLVQGGGAFRVLSGRDGSVVWEHEVSDYDPFYSESLGTVGISLSNYPNVTGDLNSDGIRDIVIPVDEFGKPELRGLYFWYLSGLDGQLLSRDRIPLDAAPWVDGSAGGTTFLGDIDNDGWAEYSGGLQGLNEQGFQEPKGFAFIGRKTLITQAVAHEGETIRLKLHIPTGAYKSFRVILSTAFERESHGLSIGTWHTHFMSSLVRSGSIMNPALRGTLDQFGKGGLDVGIPRNAGLAGKELFAIAIVEDGTRPSGVLTKSTVSVIEILP